MLGEGGGVGRLNLSGLLLLLGDGLCQRKTEKQLRYVKEAWGQAVHFRDYVKVVQLVKGD